MTVEVKINGTLIDTLYIERGHNLEVDEFRGTAPCSYYYERWVPGKNVLTTGHIQHKYPDGSDKLVLTVLQDLEERGLLATKED